MKLPDIKEFINLWPKSLVVLKEKVLDYFKKNEIETDNLWFVDIDIVLPPHLDSCINVQVILFGGFLERIFESGNWPDKNFTFWTLSTKVQRVLVALLDFPISAIHVIPRYELFPKSLVFRKYDLNSDIQVIYSGRLSSQKNIEMVLAFASILQEKIGQTVELFLLGEWDNHIPKSRGRYIINSYQEIVEKFQKQLEFKKPPIIINHLNNAEWPELIKPNCLLVNFSTFVCEDFGVSIAEAQGIGVPMILSKWGGHCDVQAENAFFIDIDDIGESLSFDENIILKAQNVVNKFLTNKLENAKKENKELICQEIKSLTLSDLHRIRLLALKKYGNYVSLLGQDRLSLFAGSSSGKLFFKDYATFFSGKL